MRGFFRVGCIGLILSPACGMAAEPAKGEAKPALSQEEAADRLHRVEAWSSSEKERATASNAKELDAAIADLKRNPEVSVPLLIRSFSSKASGHDFRANCADILSQMVTPIPTAEQGHLMSIVRDASDDGLFRVHAAQFALRSSNLDAKSKGEILNMADRLLQGGVQSPNIRLYVLPKFAGNPKAVRIMLRELKRGAELGPTLWTLGRLRGKEAVGPIIEATDAQYKRVDFPRTRAYLALGEIGGPKSYDALLRYLSEEKDETRRHVIVQAVGLTKDARAKRFLLDHITDESDQYFVPALRGLKYLGDASVVPELERAMQKPLSQYKRALITSTIASVRNGPMPPTW